MNLHSGDVRKGVPTRNTREQKHIEHPRRHHHHTEVLPGYVRQIPQQYARRFTEVSSNSIKKTVSDDTRNTSLSWLLNPGVSPSEQDTSSISFNFHFKRLHSLVVLEARKCMPSFVGSFHHVRRFNMVQQTMFAVSTCLNPCYL